MLALCHTIIFSHRLVAQQADNEQRKRYPSGFKEDRRIASMLAQEVLETMVKAKVLQRSDVEASRTRLVERLEADRNSAQRDLAEEGAELEVAHFSYNNNEHEVEETGDWQCWDGEKPDINEQYSSDGEPFESVLHPGYTS
jgi:hypothetical protein